MKVARLPRRATLEDIDKAIRSLPRTGPLLFSKALLRTCTDVAANEVTTHQGAIYWRRHRRIVMMEGYPARGLTIGWMGRRELAASGMNVPFDHKPQGETT